MQKNTGSGATAEGLFTDGDAAQGVARSTLESDVMNAILLELVNAVEGQGLALDPDDNTQLHQALRLAGNASINPSAIVNGGCIVAQRPIAQLTDTEFRLGQVDQVMARIATASGAGTPTLAQAGAAWSSSGKCAQVTGLDASVQANTLEFVYRLEARDALRFANGPGIFGCALYHTAGVLLDCTVKFSYADDTEPDDWTGTITDVATSAVQTVPHASASVLQFNVADLGACQLGLQITVSISVPAGVPASAIYQLGELRLHDGALLIPFAPRVYQQELASCRRYYERYTVGSLDVLGHFVATSTTELRGFLRHGVAKRTPTVAVDITPATDLEVVPGGLAVSAISELGGNISDDGVKITATSSSLTAGNTYLIRAKQDKIIDVLIEAGLFDYDVNAAGSAPAAPATITVPVGTDTDGNYSVSWDASVGALGYQLRERHDGGAWELVFDGSSTSKNFSASPNGTYKYEVRAYNADGFSAWTVSTQFSVDRTPAAPATITVPTETDTDGAFAISWAASTGATSYELQQQKDGGTWTTVFDGSDTSTGLSGRTDGTYKYRVRACNSSGCSTYTESTSFSVDLPPPAPVLTVDGRFKGYDASWTAVAGADTYELQHAVNDAFLDWITVFNGDALSYSRLVFDPTEFRVRVRAIQNGVPGDWSLQHIIHTT